jgi:hypothetical protein
VIPRLFATPPCESVPIQRRSSIRNRQSLIESSFRSKHCCAFCPSFDCRRRRWTGRHAVANELPSPRARVVSPMSRRVPPDLPERPLPHRLGLVLTHAGSSRLSGAWTLIISWSLVRVQQGPCIREALKLPLLPTTTRLLQSVASDGLWLRRTAPKSESNRRTVPGSFLRRGFDPIQQRWGHRR